MTVEQAIAAFASYRQESALLADFKTLWTADIPECFEKGIKRMFLVLMNSGTKDEILEDFQCRKRYSSHGVGCHCSKGFRKSGQSSDRGPNTSNSMSSPTSQREPGPVCRRVLPAHRLVSARRQCACCSHPSGCSTSSIRREAGTS
nr:uncharacterized protein LOC119180110 [Rhipicephalus microplus]